MNTNIKKFLDFGIYNNTMYFPNTYSRTKDYLNNIKPLINEIKSTNKSELLDYLKDNDVNIYSLSICISIIGLNSTTYPFIERKIQDYKSLFVFLWIFTIIKPIQKNKYLNRLFLDKIIFVENNLNELFKIYKPSYSIKKEIHKKIKEKYKIRYILETQENLSSILSKIIEYNIKPLDIKIEMEFTFDSLIKSNIIEYFIENNNIVDLLYQIDRWYIDSIPNSVLVKIELSLHKLNNIKDIYNLLILNTSLKHIELNNLINNQIKLLDGNIEPIKMNINYIPNMKLNMKWDNLHSYNSYVASVISILNENFDTYVNLKEINISTKNTFDLYNEVLNNTSFSLNKGNEIQKTNVTSVLFSNDIVKGYDVLWNITEESCPIYIDNDYLSLVGKNYLLIENFLKYIYELNKKQKKNNSTSIN